MLCQHFFKMFYSKVFVRFESACMLRGVTNFPKLMHLGRPHVRNKSVCLDRTLWPRLKVVSPSLSVFCDISPPRRRFRLTCDHPIIQLSPPFTLAALGSDDGWLGKSFDQFRIGSEIDAGHRISLAAPVVH